MAGKTVFEVVVIKQCKAGEDSRRKVRGTAGGAFAAAEAAVGLCTEGERVFQVKRLYVLAFEV